MTRTQLPLTNSDLIELGRVSAWWAMAEAELERLLVSLAFASPDHATTIVPERFVNFERKADAIRKLAKVSCVNHERHREACRCLLIEGRKIKNERKTLSHSIAVRRAWENADHIDFIDNGYPWNPKPVVAQKKLADIAALSTRMCDWYWDLVIMSFLLRYDGPLSSPDRSIEQLYNQATLSWEAFRTIPKIPPIRQVTIPPTPPQPSR